MADDPTPWTDNIVWQHADGTVSVTYCAPGTDVAAWSAELIRRGDAPEGATCLGTNLPLPTKDEFRNAWAVAKGAVTVDLTRAAETRREQLRRERAPMLAALDVEYQRADENGDAAAKRDVAARKQALRDITKHPALAKAKTLDDLRAVKCEAP